ncbi:MAG: aldo/keto reductase [Alphaproteobacteria bacterium]|nr:aldo/keto reductase [Alphaproteobacteria bacterium]
MDEIARRRIGTTDLKVTEVGFGGAALGNLFASVADADAEAALDLAFERGLRLFDTAPFYGFGLSEERMGRVLSTKPRESFVLSTKVGRLVRALRAGEAMPPQFVQTGAAALTVDYDYSRDGVRRSIEASLRRLDLDRIDIALVHDIGEQTHGAGHEPLTRMAMQEGLPALNDMKREGLIGAVGIGVNEIAVCERTLREAEVDCFLLAGRYTLLEQTPLDGFFERCREANVSIVAGGPFNSRLLASRSAPGATYNYKPADEAILGRTRLIYDVCASHGVDVGAAALQFVLAHPVVAAVIPGIRTPAEVADTLARYKARLPSALWSDLRAAGLLDARAPTP